MGDWVKLPGGGWVNLDLATDAYEKEEDDGTPYLALYLPFLDEEQPNRQGMTILTAAEDIAAVSAALDRRAGQWERGEEAMKQITHDLVDTQRQGEEVRQRHEALSRELAAKFDRLRRPFLAMEDR